MHWFSRSPQGNERLTHRWVIRARILVFGVLLFALFAIIGIPFYRQLQSWMEFGPTVALSAERWKVHFVDQQSGGRSHNSQDPCYPKALPSCLAHPENLRLWTSGLTREHPQVRAAISSVQSSGEVWWGAEITPDELSRALKASATHLVLGYFIAPYDLFLDGEWVTHGQGYQFPLVIPIAANLLLHAKSRGGLKIAIYFYPNSLGSVPEARVAAQAAPGLYTFDATARFLSFADYLQRVKPSALFLANTIFSVLFFFFWLSTPKRQEYFYFSIFTLLGAAIQMRLMDFFARSLTVEVIRGIDLFLRALEAGFAFVLAMAYARVSEKLFWRVIPFVVGGGAALAVWGHDLIRFVQIAPYLPWVLYIGLYGGGAALCALQAGLLHVRVRQGAVLGHRTRRLLVFSAALFAVSILGLVVVLVADSSFERLALVWNRVAQFGLTVLLGGIVLLDYRNQEHLVQHAPVSKYHRREVLPRAVHGAILSCDLKNSEVLYRERANLGKEDNDVFHWRHRIGQILVKNGGVILTSQGDSVICLFDQADHAQPLESALTALRECAQSSLEMGRYFFRSAVVLGEVRPTWEEIEGERSAGWEESGAGTPFVKLARLLDLERGLFRGGHQVTSILLPENSGFSGFDQIENWERIPLHRSQDKHRQTHLFSGWALRSNQTLKKAA